MYEIRGSSGSKVVDEDTLKRFYTKKESYKELFRISFIDPKGEKKFVGQGAFTGNAEQKYNLYKNELAAKQEVERMNKHQDYFTNIKIEKESYKENINFAG